MYRAAIIFLFMTLYFFVTWIMLGFNTRNVVRTFYSQDFASDSLSDFMQIKRTSDSLSDMEIERLDTNTIFHPIQCPIPFCLGPERLLQDSQNLKLRQKK
jgi:hypothetical protein